MSFVLPAYDEEANIEQATREVTAAAERMFAGHEVVIVDDGSHDRTGEIAKRLAREDARIRVVHHEQNQGYGEALRSGFLASSLEYVFFTDADLQFDVTELELFIPYMGTVDVIAGYRRNRQDALVRRLLAYGWNALVRVLFYVPVRDIDCAFKLFDRRVLEEVSLESMGAMVNTELMVKLGRSGASVVEVGVTHRPRRAGRARGASPRVILRALRELLRMRAHLSSLDGSRH